MYWKQCEASFIVAVIIYLQLLHTDTIRNISDASTSTAVHATFFSLHSLCITKTYLVGQCIKNFGKKKIFASLFYSLHGLLLINLNIHSIRFYFPCFGKKRTNILVHKLLFKRLMVSHFERCYSIIALQMEFHWNRNLSSGIHILK